MLSKSIKVILSFTFQLEKFSEFRRSLNPLLAQKGTEDVPDGGTVVPGQPKTISDEEICEKFEIFLVSIKNFIFKVDFMFCYVLIDLKKKKKKKKNFFIYFQ